VIGFHSVITVETLFISLFGEREGDYLWSKNTPFWEAFMAVKASQKTVFFDQKLFLNITL
jgi:hypothetical protein